MRDRMIYKVLSPSKIKEKRIKKVYIRLIRAWSRLFTSATTESGMLSLWELEHSLPFYKRLFHSSQFRYLTLTNKPPHSVASTSYLYLQLYISTFKLHLVELFAYVNEEALVLHSWTSILNEQPSLTAQLKVINFKKPSKLYNCKLFYCVCKFIVKKVYRFLLVYI